MGHCHEGLMQLVQKALPDLQSDRPLGYKTQCSFGAIIESPTALNNNQPLNQLSTLLFQHDFVIQQPIVELE